MQSRHRGRDACAILPCGTNVLGGTLLSVGGCVDTSCFQARLLHYRVFNIFPDGNCQALWRSVSSKVQLFLATLLGSQKWIILEQKHRQTPNGCPVLPSAHSLPPPRFCFAQGTGTVDKPLLHCYCQAIHFWHSSNLAKNN